MECTLKDRLSGVATSRQKCFCLHKILTKKPIPSSLLNEAEISRTVKRTIKGLSEKDCLHLKVALATPLTSGAPSCQLLFEGSEMNFA